MQEFQDMEESNLRTRQEWIDLFSKKVSKLWGM